MKIKRVFSGILCCVLFFGSAFPSMASAAQTQKVTVAYIDYIDFVKEEADGTYTGYGADYLRRIADYTGWEYEFVRMDWPAALAAVKAGDVDLYCVARQTEARQTDYDFSLYPICDEEMNIYTLPDNDVYYEDFEALDGMRVGVLAQSAETDIVRRYAAENGFSCEVVEFPLNEAAVEALRKGEIDAAAVVHYSVGAGLKLVGHFGVAPAYMMSHDGSEIMAQFSRAQERLYFDDPTFTQKLTEKYYGGKRFSDELLLTRQETEYIQSAGTLTVAASVDMAPIEYYDERAGAFSGTTVDLYRRISELTGLRFRFVRREDAPALIAQMESGEVQLVGALAQNPAVAAALHIEQTKPFSESAMSLVTRDITKLNADSVVAVPAGYPQFVATAKQFGYTKVREYATFEECVQSVYTGETDLAYIISMCEGYLLKHASYAELRSAVCAGTEYNITFGVSNACDPRLLSIMNKCIAAIPVRDVNSSIVSSTATVEPKLTFADYLSKNGALLFCVGVLLAALSALAVIRTEKSRRQRMLNQSLRERYDFLQHLYDTLPCGVFQYAYEEPHLILSANAACAKIYGYDKEFPVVGKTPEAVVKEGTTEAFLLIFRRCAESGGPTMYVWPITRKDGSEAYVECVMEVVETGRGKVFQEVIIDVTERVANEQRTEKRYLQELNRHGSEADGFLYTACFDITEQVLVQTSIDVPGIHAGMTVNEFTANLLHELEELQTQDALEDFRTRFTAERMERAYDDGEFEQSFLLCRREADGFQYLRSDLALRINPATGHLMCFDYIWDVTDEQVTGDIVRRMAFNDCEYVACVYAPTAACLQYAIGADGALARQDTVYGETDSIRRMAAKMKPEDAAEFLQATALDTVVEKLSSAPRYQVYATLYDEEGRRRDKALNYFYTHEETRVFAISVSDVTEVRSAEVRRAQLLSDALTAAEQADAAKSQFLSRVSHEMRTPLNAIIGFIELAKGADAETTMDYLASSDIAAKQLLNVINDVLDMSSIESGKLQIAKASFNFRHLVSSITVLSRHQNGQERSICDSAREIISALLL